MENLEKTDLQLILNNVYKIFMPYGIRKTDEGWDIFNREYLKLGDYPDFYNQNKIFIKYGFSYEGIDFSNMLKLIMPTKYAEIPDEILSIFPRAENQPNSIVFFYNDSNKPVFHDPENPNTKLYMENFKKIAKYGIKVMLPHHLNN
jgi:hypothetical protein